MRARLYLYGDGGAERAVGYVGDFLGDVLSQPLFAQQRKSSTQVNYDTSIPQVTNHIVKYWNIEDPGRAPRCRAPRPCQLNDNKEACAMNDEQDA